MSDPRWQRMWDLFHAALEEPPERREAFLAESCGEDAALRERLDRLLSAHERAPRVLEEPTSAPPLDAEDLQDPLIGDRIGPYRIDEVIGEGGMGVVYAARQEQPVRRRVALKLIRAGMATHEVVARFEAERQALALMGHPAIASVFDGGATEAGRPYFVMEHVEGTPITEYCDTHRLDTGERLELFLKVCDGVRHAHQKGIIHRDLKPSNVLVATQDGKPAPKIIDFGVAKAMDQRLTEKTMFTSMGAWVGTPAYMSPEQAEMGALDVDTRTDVYSLGVLLYELLAGALPFDARELREAGFDETRRKIREDEPSKPSTRFSTLGGEISTEVARRRRTDVLTLRRRLAGDLDWITMKALEKDRARRYGSVGELAEDLGRHLRDEPVVAGPPSAAYRARKFFRRHKVATSFGALSSTFLLVVAVSITIQAGRIARERDRANREAAAKGQVLGFLLDLFKVSDPDQARGNTITARELLDRGAREIDETLEGQPEVRAELMAMMAEVYRSLGLYAEAEPLIRRSVEARRRLLGDRHPETLSSINTMGLLAWDRGKLEEAEDHFREALEGRRRALGTDHPDTASSLNNFGLVLRDQGRLAEAEVHLREALEIRRRALGGDHRDVAQSLGNMGQLFLNQGELAKAEEYLRESLQTRRRVAGEDHPETLIALNDMGRLLMLQGKLKEAESLLRDAVEGNRRVLGDDHRETLTSLDNLAGVLEKQGRLDEAEECRREGLEASRRALGDDHPVTVTAINNMGVLTWRQGRPAEAEVLFRQALEASRRLRGSDHPETLTSMDNLGYVLRVQGKLGEAEPYFRGALEGRRRALGEEHVDTLRSMGNLGDLYTSLGRHEDAEPLLAGLVERARRALPRERVGPALRMFGRCLTGLRRYDEAEAALLEAHEIVAAASGPEHRRTLRVVRNLVELYEAWGKPAPAAAWRARLPPAGARHSGSP